MAKPLSTAVVNPLSRLLDPATAMRAVAAPQPSTMPEQRQPVLSQSQSGTWAAVPSFVKRECVLTRSTDEALTRFTELIRRTTGARVSASHAVRCLLLTLGPVWPRLEDELRALGPMRLPSNARGNEASREALELALAGAVARAVRSSEPPG
ncbi:MAG: hypothetical protein AMXMBFR58_27460 [Phycisphaerae bacterium]